MMSKKNFDKKKIVFVFLNSGEKISFSNDNLIVKDKNDNIKLQATCYRVWALLIVGSFTITTGLIQRSHKFGFPIFLLTYSLKLYDRLGSYMEGNVVLRKKQYSYEGLRIGTAIITNKVSNQLALLKERRNKSQSLKDDIDKLESYLLGLKGFSGSLQELLGVEGNVAKIYFKHQFDNVDWRGRKPRVKGDFVNSSLDIGYSILFNVIEALLSLFGFDTFKGVLHTEFYMRKSLVCDIMEPFRVLIDNQIRKVINLRQLQVDDFTLVNHAYQLSWNSNKKVVALFLQAILERKSEIFSYIQNYYRFVMRNKDIKEFPEFNWSKKENDNSLL